MGGKVRIIRKQETHLFTYTIHKCSFRFILREFRLSGLNGIGQIKFIHRNQNKYKNNCTCISLPAPRYILSYVDTESDELSYGEHYDVVGVIGPMSNKAAMFTGTLYSFMEVPLIGEST